MNSSNSVVVNRRQFLRGFGTLCGAVLASPAFASGTRQVQPAASASQLAFHNIHTGESSVCTLCETESQAAEQQHQFSHILRDWRNDNMTDMDPRLLVLLSKLHRKVGATQPINIISGYRSPATNEMLRSSSSGVAKFSYHTRGQAIDMNIPGIPLSQLHKAARELGLGGVGYYPASGFVHVDTGPVRYWG